MNDYERLRVDIDGCTPEITDLLASDLADIGFESFEPDENGLTAYIAAEIFSEQEAQDIIANQIIPFKSVITHSRIEGRDWNEEWEHNYFKPIVIGGRCVIHSTFHTDIPEAEYDIVIDPKMAFGTGYHATTALMTGFLLDMSLAGKTLIDMGTGTGILSILAAKRGAASAVGIELDSGAWEDAKENARLNGVNITLLHGDARRLEDVSPADIFLANINRNVILADFDAYASHIVDGGTMLLSGFYESDIPLIEARAAVYGLKLEEKRNQGEWVALRLKKGVRLPQ